MGEDFTAKIIAADMGFSASASFPNNNIIATSFLSFQVPAISIAQSTDKSSSSANTFIHNPANQIIDSLNASSNLTTANIPPID